MQAKSQKLTSTAPSAPSLDKSKYNCDNCEKVFISISSLEKHNQRVHKTKDVFTFNHHSQNHAESAERMKYNLQENEHKEHLSSFQECRNFM